MPKDVESWYQEIGRAGRPGLPSDCFLFCSWADGKLRDRFLDDIEGDALGMLTYGRGRRGGVGRPGRWDRTGRPGVHRVQRPGAAGDGGAPAVELIGISEIGPKKLETYGDVFLNAIAEGS